ncbi:C39 family peptidase [Terrabacter terrigena]|uniref:C39 family peptidase n=1 Tax=Terrabacter terrigena TaxID=574718 RepID=A0ABW3MYA5_9MICO
MRALTLRTAAVLAVVAAMVTPSAAAAASAPADTRPLTHTLSVPTTGGHGPVQVSSPGSVSVDGEHYVPTPYSAQPNGYYCGPTSVHMALALRGVSPGITALARELGTTTEGTGPTPIVAAALRSHTGAPYETTVIPWNGGAISSTDIDRLWRNVVTDVDGGYAVVAYVYAPAHQYPYHDVAHPIEHYFVVDGYDTRYRTVRISDPADFDGRGRYWIPVDRLAYLVAGTPGYAW